MLCPILLTNQLSRSLIAPVDTMGCDQAGDDLPDLKPLTEKVRKPDRSFNGVTSAPRRG